MRLPDIIGFFCCTGILIFAESASTFIAVSAKALLLTQQYAICNMHALYIRVTVSLQGIVITTLIITQCVTPFLVATSMSGIQRTNIVVLDSVSYTRAVVATIGIKMVTYGCLSHTIQVSTCILVGKSRIFGNFLAFKTVFVNLE